MKRYKRFCLVILGVLLTLLLYNAVVWHCCTRQLLTRAGGVHTGDLARMGYLSAYAVPRTNIDDLPRRHMEIADWNGAPVDIVTVGDSFSGGAGGGLNRYYQDYLATASQASVLNVGRYPTTGNLLETVAILANSGLLDQLRPKYLLLEIVERNGYKHAGAVDLTRTDSLENVHKVYLSGSIAAVAADDEEAGDLPPVGFINTGNAKWLLYNLLYSISPNAFGANTYKVPLERRLFSAGPGNVLLFLRKDIEKVKKHDARTMQALNDNLNRLAKLLRDRGVELVFMPAPDKYTLYRPYLSDQRWPASRYFELLRPLVKSYRFIDTEAILAREIARGEADIYYLDDTHWNWKASKAIFEQATLP
ncbi:MAG: alginate O-acetyltransferase AlgX-related protein [Desulfuromonadales bacterium]